MTKVDTRTAILDMAETQVRTKGHNGFSYADLSEAVGIRKASIHYHFPAKADLLTALMERYNQTVLQHLEEVEQSSSNAAERLDRYVTLYREALKDCHCLCLCLVLTLGQDSLSDETRSVIEVFRKAALKWLEAAFQAAAEDGSVRDIGNPADEARALFAMVEGAQISARSSGDLAIFDAATKLFRARLTLPPS